MKTRLLAWTCMFILLSSIVFAATATIVNEPTERDPGCKGLNPECNALYVEADNNEVVKYTVKNVEPDTNYTVSFLYKMEAGSFSFSTNPAHADATDVPVIYGWTEFSTTFDTSAEADTFDMEIKFTATDDNTNFYIDNLQMVPSPEPTKFVDFDYDAGCCPFDFCWNGTACVHSDFYENDVSKPPLGWDGFDMLKDFVKAPSGYRCINGSWVFSRAKFTPLYDSAGYCPVDSQCFLGAETPCVDSGTYYPYGNPSEWFYCYDGNWTTRTKEIAMQMMLNMANEDDTYTIFCDKFNRVLNTDESFRMWRDYFGEDASLALGSDDLNEFCVMDLNGQIVGGVSLNNPDINDPISTGGWLPEEGDEQPEGKSFIQLLKGDQNADYCDNTLPADGEEPENAYIPCKSDDVYYNPKLNIVFFAKPHDRPRDDRQAVPFNEQTSTFFEIVFNYLKGVLSDLLDIAGLARPQTAVAQKSELAFIQTAGSFDKLYISHDPTGPAGPRSIKAIRETRFNPEDPEHPLTTFISAEYHNYQVDICRFFYHHNYPEIREQISGNNNIQCTPVVYDDTTWMHSVYVEEPVFDEDIPAEYSDLKIWSENSDSFWNDITSNIRTQDVGQLPGDAPTVPVITHAPEENPVAGSPVTFTIGDTDQDIIARTWDFGDGKSASSSYDITVKHTYLTKGQFNVQLCVMNSAFKISCDSSNIDIGEGPSISIEEVAQTADQRLSGAVTVDFKVSGGNSPYAISVDWGEADDDSDVSTCDSETCDGFYPFDLNGGQFSATHTYELTPGYTDETFTIVVHGSDRDMIFDNQKSIAVHKDESDGLGLAPGGVSQFDQNVLPGNLAPSSG